MADAHDLSPLSPVKVFISYSHADADLATAVRRHLFVLELEKLITPWSDHLIDPGGMFDEVISEELEAAELILLLVSSGFIASPYCVGREAARAIEKTLAKQALMVPIVLKPCAWRHVPFGNPPRTLGEFVALPADGRAVVDWPSVDHALLDVTEKLRALIRRRLRPMGATR